MVRINIHGPLKSLETWALLDTGAESNFIDSKIANELDLPLGSLVNAITANKTSIDSFSVKGKVVIEVSSHPFSLDLISTRNLSFPIILGYSWWKACRAYIIHKKNLVSFCKKIALRWFLYTLLISKHQILGH